MTSASDSTVIAVCQSEQRCLVTLELDFSNPLQFDPSKYSDIAVLRLPPRAFLQDLTDAIQTLIGGLERESITKKFWIIQPGRIRIYQQDIAQ